MMKKRICARSGEVLVKDFGRIEVAQMVIREKDLQGGFSASAYGTISTKYNLTTELTEEATILLKAFVEKKISVAESPSGLLVKIQLPDSEHIAFLLSKKEIS
jgi:transcription initiation factor TFIIIB Brf1 subunit/transcription initiation factor TFIIB